MIEPVPAVAAEVWRRAVISCARGAGLIAGCIAGAALAPLLIAAGLAMLPPLCVGYAAGRHLAGLHPVERRA